MQYYKSIIAFDTIDVMSSSSSALEKNNMHLMKTLDDAWNSQDWDTFSKRHADNVVVRWPAQPPTNGIDAHRKEGEYSFSAFPDNHVQNNTPIKCSSPKGIGLALLQNSQARIRGR